MIFASIALAFWCYRAAAALQSVRDPPLQHQLGVGLGWDQLSELDVEVPPRFGYSVVVLVQLRRCRNPARVTLDFTFPTHERFWRAHAALFKRRADMLVSVTDASAREFRLYKPGYELYDPEGGLTFTPTANDRLPAQIETFPLDPLRVRMAITHLVWGHDSPSGESPEFVTQFDANWVEPRGHRSCYVRLPDLTGRWALVANAIAFEANSGVFPAHGTIRVAGPSGGPLIGRLDPFESIPPPDDIRASSWTCSSSTRATCDAIAVVEEPNAAGDTESRLFVYGALLGLLLALAIDSLRRIRIPPP